ncbi:MAG: hypothetical protein MRY49_03125 [Candidatus Pacebacteria bacterium]|nr:hypothetical protein [Candidatus Paceibacterota bacterium]
MNKITYYKTVSIVFFIVSMAHLLRNIYGWDVYIGDLYVPEWVSWVVVVFIGYLSIRGFKFLKR